MNKRVLSKIPRQSATDEMIKTADRIGGLRHMVTAELIGDGTMVMMHIYRISELKKGKRNAEFRTFISKEDYINQRLDTDKVRWLTASLCMISGFVLFESHWNEKRNVWDRTEFVYIRSREEKELLCDFFREYAREDDKYAPWSAVYRFQEAVKAKRLALKHKKKQIPLTGLWRQ